MKFLLNFELLKINDIFKNNVCSFVYKAIQRSLPSCFDDIFIYNHKRHNINLRNKKNLMCQHVKRLFSRQSLLFISAETWNSMPDTIRSKKKLTKFKKKCTQYLVQCYKIKVVTSVFKQLLKI